MSMTRTVSSTTNQVKETFQHAFSHQPFVKPEACQIYTVNKDALGFKNPDTVHETEPFPLFDSGGWKEDEQAKQHCYIHCQHYNCRMVLVYDLDTREEFKGLNIRQCRCDGPALENGMPETVISMIENHDITINTALTQSEQHALECVTCETVVKVLKSDIKPFIASLEYKFASDARLRLISIGFHRSCAYDLETDEVGDLDDLNSDPFSAFFGALSRILDSYLEETESLMVRIAELHWELMNHVDMVLVYLFKPIYGKSDVQTLRNEQRPGEVWDAYEEIVERMMQLIALRDFKENEEAKRMQ